MSTWLRPATICSSCSPTTAYHRRLSSCGCRSGGELKAGDHEPQKVAQLHHKPLIHLSGLGLPISYSSKNKIHVLLLLPSKGSFEMQEEQICDCSVFMKPLVVMAS